MIFNGFSEISEYYLNSKRPILYATRKLSDLTNQTSGFEKAGR